MKYQISVNQITTDRNQKHINTSCNWLEDWLDDALTDYATADKAYQTAVAVICALEDRTDYVNVYTVELLEQSRGDGYYPVKSKTIIK